MGVGRVSGDHTRPWSVKGVILAGGTGSRLDPLTRVTNKHLLPVYDRPMVQYPIELLVGAGIRDALIVTGGRDADRFAKVFGDGSGLGACLSYEFQERPAGIADALARARRFADGEPICLVLGDNIFGRSVRESAERFQAQQRGARILLAEVERPQSYGVAVIAGDRVVRIEEKPARPSTRWAVTGCYFYDADVFAIVDSLAPSARGELEITDVNNAYIARGLLQYDATDGYWVDCGESFESYLRAQNLVAERGANR